MSIGYEKPTIKKLEASLMNKFGQGGMPSQNVRTAIDGVNIDDLPEMHLSFIKASHRNQVYTKCITEQAG